MISFIEKLAQLERRIQSLVERGATPSLAKSGNLGAQMVAAVEQSIARDESGRSTAADLYILSVDKNTAQILQNNPGLVDQLGQMIAEAGQDLGLDFAIPPNVKINADASLDPGKFAISARYSLQSVEETNTLTIENNDRIGIPAYAFLIVNGVQVYPLDESVINIGRRPDNHVVIEDVQVSRVHAQIRAVKGRYVIFDLDSSGGTYVNGVRTSRTTLYPGDVISLAGVSLVYGEDAAYLSGDDKGSTQPLMPFPDKDN